MSTAQTNEQILDAVRERYANAAKRVASSATSGASCCEPECCATDMATSAVIPVTNLDSCCGPACCETENVATTPEAFGASLYPTGTLAVLPAEAVAASLG